MATLEDSEKSGPPTFEDLGIPQSERTHAQPVNTVFGQRRQWISLTKLEVAFMIIAFLSILGAFGLTIERIVDLAIKDNNQSTDDFTFAIILLINTGFCLFYIVNGVFGEREFELLVFVGGVLILLGYCILNFIVSSPNTDHAIKLIRLILVSVFGPINIAMGLIIARRYYQSGNLIFRTVGANIDLQKICRNMNLCESLLKFDFQLQVSLVIMILKPDSIISEMEIIVISIGIPFSVCYAFLGWLALRFENKIMSVIFLLASVGEPAYIIYKIVYMSKHWDHDMIFMPSLIIVASWIGLCVRLLLLIVFIRAYRNFGKGLKERAYENRPSTSEVRTREVPPYQSFD